MKSNLFKLDILILLSLLSLIKLASSIEFVYPSSVSLNNGNIFIIEKMGIFIYDEQLTNIIHEYPFTEENEKIDTLDKLSNIIIKKTDNYIICLINLRIYFFNEEGDFLLKGNETITNDECYHLALTPIPINDDNNFYYTVGFYTYSIQNEVYIFHLIYNKIDLNENKNDYINSIEFNIFVSSFWGSRYNFLNQGLDCEYMLKESSYSIYQLVCFVIIKRKDEPTLSQIFFDVTESAIYKSNDYYYDYVEYLDEVKKLQSITNNNRQNTLICLLFNDKSLKCYAYKFASKGNFYQTIGLNFNCRNELYGMKLNYLEGYEKISLSCINDISTVQANFFSDQFNSVASYVQFTNCESIFGHSIIYSNSKLNVISDVVCDNATRSYEALDGVLSPIIEVIEIINPTDDSEEEEESVGEEEQFDCSSLEKCKKCNQESFDKNLCISCNEEKNYYYINYNPLQKKGKYIDCVNEETKPQRYYLNIEEKEYDPCFETCATCERGGNYFVHNCKTCDEINYTKNPEDENSSNCVKKCEYFYYMSYNQYSCTEKPICPDEYNLMIKEKSKCTNDCMNDLNNNFRYDGQCFNRCPMNTEDIDNSHFCKDKDNQCAITKNDMNYLEETLSDSLIDKLVKKYDEEFSYTNNHISMYENLECSIIIYINSECIQGYIFDLLKIDLGDCYQKMLEKTSGEKLIIIVIIKKDSVNGKKSMEFKAYSPTNKEYINIDELCKEDKMLLEQSYPNLEFILNNSISNLDIDLFDLSNPLYTDICYQFDSEKDVALKDRVSIYYPNIKLCDDGCELKGINLTINSTICECFLTESKREENLKNKVLEQAQLEALNEIISKSNFYVLKCIKLIFDLNIIKRCYGAFIISGFIIIEISCFVFYLLKNVFSLKKYIFSITNKFINNLQSNELKIKDNKDKHNPPPKQKLIAKKSSNSINLNNKIIHRKKSKKGRKTATNKNINLIINSNKNVMQVENNYIVNDENKIYTNKQNEKSKKHKSMPIYKLKKNEDSSNSTRKKLNFNSNNNLFSIENDDIDINIDEFFQTQLDDMDYDETIRKEKRKFCECFLEKLKNEQIIINTFYSIEPIKPRAIKIVLLVLNINLYFFVNGLFYNDNYISKVYHLKKDTFSTKAERFLDNLIYTTFAGIVFNFIIEFFFIEEIKLKRILKFEKDNISSLKNEMNKILKSIKVRCIFFVILTLIISFLTLIHIACFNIVYRHIMTEWIIFSLIIVLLIQIATFLFCLFQTGMRFMSLKCKSEKLFKLSQVKL